MFESYQVNIISRRRLNQFGSLFIVVSLAAHIVKIFLINKKLISAHSTVVVGHYYKSVEE